MGKYREYSDKDIIKYSKEVKSMAGLLRKLGLRIAGGNYANMKRSLQRLGIECSHWTGQAWNKDQQLKNWSEYTKAETLRPHLIRSRGHACEVCKNTGWNKKPIPLEVHHKDGDRTNNSIENLQLLCPNCHAQTKTYRGKNIK